MKNREVKDKVKTAFESVTPDNIDNIREQVSGAEQVSVPVTAGTKKKKSVLWRIALGAACIAILVLGGLGIYGYNLNYAVATEISFDVNPSITMEVNAKGKVRSVRANNADAEKVIAGLDFNGSTYEVAVNAVIGLMLRTGYLSEIANSVLVSVNDGKTDRSAQIEQAVLAEIETLFSSEKFDGAVICQSIAENNTISQLAKDYGITLGKANLIDKIVQTAAAANAQTAYAHKDLVGLTINELNVLAESLSVDLGASVSGTASTQGYLAIDSIKQIALGFAGIAEDGIRGNIEAEFDFENGVIVYEVSFKTADFEYEVEINAISGELVAISEEFEGTLGAMGGILSEEGIREAALSRAGIDLSAEITDLKIEADGNEYEIEFTCDGFRYELELRADGEILSYEKKAVFSVDGSQLAVSEEKAKEIALGKAKELAEKIGAQFDEALLADVSVEQNEDGGVISYEVEFKVGVIEFEVRINANSGAIIKAEIDLDMDLPDFDD